MQKVIKRDDYLRRLIDKKENGLIKVITGIRRCGKSFLLFNLFYDYLINSGVNEEQIITIALDDDLFTSLRILITSGFIMFSTVLCGCVMSIYM